MFAGGAAVFALLTLAFPGAAGIALAILTSWITMVRGALPGRSIAQVLYPGDAQ